MYGRVLEPAEATGNVDQKELAAGMRDDGLRLKNIASISSGIYGVSQNPFARNQVSELIGRKNSIYVQHTFFAYCILFHK